MASLDSVHQKLYRARHHFLELDGELLSYYREGPVELRVSGSSVGIEGKGAVPARFGLIAGDVLQCMRSSLDYLVWELVLANGEVPNGQNAFPISLTAKEYENQIVKRKRLFGVAPAACALIDSLQPLSLPEDKRESSPLAVLEKLTNTNKHRRILLTNLERELIADEPLRFPHMLSDINAFVPGRGKHVLATFGSYIAFDEDGISGSEIGTALNIFGDYVLNEVLPLFKKFFEIS